MKQGSEKELVSEAVVYERNHNNSILQITFCVVQQGFVKAPECKLTFRFRTSNLNVSNKQGATV